MGLFPQRSIASIVRCIGAMDVGVTVSATIGIQWLRPRGKGAAMTRVVALDAQKRHGRREQSAVGRSVRAVAIAAIFGDITMLIGEGAVFFHMTACAKVARGDSLEHLGLG